MDKKVFVTFETGNQSSEIAKRFTIALQSLGLKVEVVEVSPNPEEKLIYAIIMKDNLHGQKTS